MGMVAMVELWLEEQDQVVMFRCACGETDGAGTRASTVVRAAVFRMADHARKCEKTQGSAAMSRARKRRAMPLRLPQVGDYVIITDLDACGDWEIREAHVREDNSRAYTLRAIGSGPHRVPPAMTLTAVPLDSVSVYLRHDDPRPDVK